MLLSQETLYVGAPTAKLLRLDNLSAAEAAGPQIQRERALAHFQLARAHHHLGNYPKAELEYLVAVDLYQKLHTPPSDPTSSSSDPGDTSVKKPKVLRKTLADLPEPAFSEVMQLLAHIIALCKDTGKSGMAKIYSEKLQRMQNRQKEQQNSI
ncbi:hypothetical protein DFS34DRAFT_654827 [Phlyctochytrium arcticum]|nr:hypothetical protein DFS34DRAFT_654827 [Phlyctochytrium arcticum]